MPVVRYRVDAAPSPVTPYSHAVESQGLLFVTGQIGNDPAQPDLPLPEGIEAQTRAVFANLQAVLTAAGTSFENVLFARIYLTDFPRDYAAFNDLYNKVFPHADHLPSRTTVGVTHLAKGAIVEVDLVVRAARTTPESAR